MTSEFLNAGECEMFKGCSCSKLWFTKPIFLPFFPFPYRTERYIEMNATKRARTRDTKVSASKLVPKLRKCHWISHFCEHECRLKNNPKCSEELFFWREKKNIQLTINCQYYVFQTQCEFFFFIVTTQNVCFVRWSKVGSKIYLLAFIVRQKLGENVLSSCFSRSTLFILLLLYFGPRTERTKLAEFIHIQRLLANGVILQILVPCNQFRR